jgi:hypothetical protein
MKVMSFKDEVDEVVEAIESKNSIRFERYIWEFGRNVFEEISLYKIKQIC